MALRFTSSVVVELHDAHVSFAGRPALRGVSGGFRAGSLTVIAGRNGAGKSTLLEVLAGTRTPTSGRRESATDAVAFVPQRAAVSERLPVTLRDVVTIGVWGSVGPWRRVGARERRRVDNAIHTLGLGALQRVSFAALSGGQQQRALLAQGLARGADLLLLDEPTTSLDVDSAAQIVDAMAREARRGAAVVCVSHDRCVIDVADTVITLEEGRIASSATAEAEAPRVDGARGAPA